MRTAIATSLLTVLVVACGGGESATRQASEPAGTTAQEAAQQETTSTETEATNEIGVAECDAYVEKFMACIDKVPAQAQAAVRQGFEQSRVAWQQAAATLEGRDGLAMACRQADEAASVGMQAYGCAW